LCAQLRVINLTGGKPVCSRPSQPAVASLELSSVMVGAKRRQRESRVEMLLSSEILFIQMVDVLIIAENNIT